MSERINGNDPKRVHHQHPAPRASYAMQAGAGHVGKVSRSAIEKQGKFDDVARMYDGHMQGRKVTKGFPGAADIHFPFPA